MRKYVLYCNNIDKNTIDVFKQAISSIDKNVNFEILDLFNIHGIASRGMAPVSISLCCYAIINTNINNPSPITKVFNNGLGHGISLLNIDIENYKNEIHISDKEKVIDIITNKIIDSILFCQNHIEFI